MPDSTLVSILVNGGVAGVFCILFLLGWVYPKTVVADLRAERDALRVQVEAERDRAETAVAAAQTTNDVLTALQAGVVLGHRQHDQGGPRGLGTA